MFEAAACSAKEEEMSLEQTLTMVSQPNLAATTKPTSCPVGALSLKVAKDRAKYLKTTKEYVWIDDDQALQHESYETTLELATRRMSGSDAPTEVERHLMPVANWFVPGDETTDHTAEGMVRGKEHRLSDTRKPVSKNKKVYDRQKSHGWSAAGDNEAGRKMKCHLVTPLPRATKRIQSRRRRHYRSVLEEAAEPVFALTRLSDMFIVLRDVAKVLYYMHVCGFVHRDISAGDLYLFESRSLLGDLEYAERKRDDLPHELLIGTLDFMAIEVRGRRYRFNERDTKDDIKQKRTFARKVLEGTATGHQKRKMAPPFFHNDLHDMESMWWISIWILFFCHDKYQPENDEGKIRERRSVASTPSHRTHVFGDRREFFGSDQAFEERLAWLKDSLMKVKAQLDVLRSFLHFSYKAFEGTFPDYTFDAFQDVQATFQEFFNNCVICSGGIELAPFKTTGPRGAKGNTRDRGQSTHTPPVTTVPVHAADAPSEPTMPLPDPVTALSDSSSSSSLGKRKPVVDVYIP